MSLDFQELDYRKTRLGELILRRRRIRSLDNLEVYEVKLGEDFLMSSLFHESETALARLGLAGQQAAELDVAVGGLGLGYTARAALENPRVRSLIVVDALAEVIEWHERGLVPLGPELTSDPRCRFVHDDFFVRFGGAGASCEAGDQRYHAILLDVDHSPRNLLSPAHAGFYHPTGLRRLTSYLHPGGSFALWSDDAPDPDFMRSLEAVFVSTEAHVVQFENPLLEKESSSTVYVARVAG